MNKIHNLIILDESGSMESIKKTVIQGFNEIVQTIKGIELKFPEQEHFISLLSFNSLENKVLHFIDPAQKLEEINDTSYRPNAGTPLYDAMGFGINKLKQHLADHTDYNVLVTILTDGEENASKEYKGIDIKKMVDELKTQGWTFTYIGAEHDVESFAANISITNTLVFHKNKEDMDKMFAREAKARNSYSQKIHYKQEVNEGFYDDSDELLDDTKKQ
jgi:Mg-chelatase subunit ChlD